MPHLFVHLLVEVDGVAQPVPRFDEAIRSSARSADLLVGIERADVLTDRVVEWLLDIGRRVGRSGFVAAVIAALRGRGDGQQVRARGVGVWALPRIRRESLADGQVEWLWLRPIGPLPGRAVETATDERSHRQAPLGDGIPGRHRDAG